MNKTIGIAGGGQLGRMLSDAAHNLGLNVIILDPTENSPAGQVADEQIMGDYKDGDLIRALAAKCDVMTFEIESVNEAALIELSAQGFPVHPTPHTLALIKDKLKQKQFLQERGILVGPFAEVENTPESLALIGNEFRYPNILKARSGGFDGRGNTTVESVLDIPRALESLLGQRLYAEKFVKFEKELAIVAARTAAGEVVVYPLVETVHKNHICHMTLMPATVSNEVTQKAHDVAEKVLQSFDGAGVFGIELFLVDGEILVNEIAPRVHNSGHWTIEGCETSQFENHIRAITEMPLGSVALKAPAAVMINILGDRSGSADPQGVEVAEKIEGVKVHIYGKMETRNERKMGHLTATAQTLDEAREKAEQARKLISI